jgi:hypothetical protein
VRVRLVPHRTTWTFKLCQELGGLSIYGLLLVAVSLPSIPTPTGPPPTSAWTPVEVKATSKHVPVESTLTVDTPFMAHGYPNRFSSP